MEVVLWSGHERPGSFRHICKMTMDGGTEEISVRAHALLLTSLCACVRACSVEARERDALVSLSCFRLEAFLGFASPPSRDFEIGNGSFLPHFLIRGGDWSRPASCFLPRTCYHAP